MKKFTLLNVMLLTLFFILFAGFRYEGFYSAIFMREDLQHYLVLFPFFSGITIFSVVYMAMRIKWKNILQEWQNILAILTAIVIGVCLLFSSEIYLMTSTTLQIIIIISILSSILITTSVNYFKIKK